APLRAAGGAQASCRCRRSDRSRLLHVSVRCRRRERPPEAAACASRPLAAGKLAPVPVAIPLGGLPRYRRSVAGAGAAASDASQHEAASVDDSGSSSLNALLSALFDSACQSWTFSAVTTPRRKTFPKSSTT